MKIIVRAAFANTKEEYEQNWAKVSTEVKAYLLDAGAKLEQFIKILAIEKGIQINNENTSNRVEQEMNRTKKLGIRHTIPLKGKV